MAQVRCPTCGRFMASENPHDHAAQQDAPLKRMVLPPRRRRVPASVAMARAVVSPDEETRPDAPTQRPSRPAVSPHEETLSPTRRARRLRRMTSTMADSRTTPSRRLLFSLPLRRNHLRRSVAITAMVNPCWTTRRRR